MPVELQDRRNITYVDLKFLSKVANNPDLQDRLAEDTQCRKKVRKRRSFKYGLSHSMQELSVRKSKSAEADINKKSEKVKRTTLEPGFELNNVKTEQCLYHESKWTNEGKYRKSFYGRLLECLRRLKKSVGGVRSGIISRFTFGFVLTDVSTSTR